MNTYKNKNYTARNYECTNVIACVAENAPDENWIKCSENVINGMQQLWVIAGVRYYGFL